MRRRAIYSYRWDHLRLAVYFQAREWEVRVWRLIRPIPYRTRRPRKRDRELWRLVFQAHEEDDQPGWIAQLAGAFAERQPIEMIFDFVRDHGLTPEMEATCRS